MKNQKCKNPPKLGEIFYWIDYEGNICESTCLKIKEEDNPQIATMYFTYLTENGGGVFVTEYDIIDSDSDEVINFKKEQAKKKLKEISNYISQKEVYNILLDKLNKNGFEEVATSILDILSNE